jgi:hypothetical protein
MAACIGAGVIALRESSDLMASATATLAVAVLLGAVLFARFGEEMRRRFFWGFAVAGWAYLILSYGPLGSPLRKDLATTVLIDRLHPAPEPNGADPQRANLWRVDHERWQLVGHSLFALLAGQAGGLLASRLGDRPDGAVEGGEVTPC